MLLNSGLAHAAQGAGTRSLIAAIRAGAKGCRREERRLIQQSNIATQELQGFP